MQAVRIEGRSIEYCLEGPADGPVLAFSNSLGTDGRVWDRLLPHLPAGLRLLRYSKAGHGLSDLARRHSIDEHAGDLLALMDALGIERATLVGLSVGGMIAQAAAARAPERVAGLVLCCTAHKIGTADLWEQRIAELAKKGLAGMADGVMERWFSAAWRAANPADLALWKNMLSRQPAEGYGAICAAIRDADLTETVRGLRQPTLCVAGTEDGSTPPEVVGGLAELIPGARLEVIEGVGHIPCVEAPERLGALVSAFLEERGLV